MIFVDLYKTLIKIPFKNDPKRSKTIQNGPKWGFWTIFRSRARNIHWLPSEFLHKVHVRPFVSPPWHVCEHTNRTKVHLNGLGRLNCVNTELMSFQNLKSMFAKRVPTIHWCSPGLQCWTHNHILPISCTWEHHVGSLKRAKVVLISKLCFVTHIWPLDNMKFVSKMIKIVSKWRKFIHRSCVWDAYTG